MEIRIREANKRPGVCYAVTDDGIELPVIDVTHPAFAFDVGEPALTAAIAATLEDLARFKTMTRDELRAVAQESILLRGGLKAGGSFMSGMTTYLHKLGPDNLGRGYASDRDRRATTQLLPLAFRHRLATVARLVADRLMAGVAVAHGPVHLFNIGGGTALDSLNAVIVARKAQAALADRPIAIHVFDVDTEGPAFGARALGALRAPGAPLHGLDVTFEHVPYDWADTAPLAAALRDASRDGALLVASSEGGLFEYGSDEHILANLRAMHEHAPTGFPLVGALLMDKATLPARLKWIGDASGIAVRLLGLSALRETAGHSGWELAYVEDGPIHHIAVLENTPA
jgi:hypothetical protein